MNESVSFDWAEAIYRSDIPFKCAVVRMDYGIKKF